MKAFLIVGIIGVLFLDFSVQISEYPGETIGYCLFFAMILLLRDSQQRVENSYNREASKATKVMYIRSDKNYWCL